VEEIGERRDRWTPNSTAPNQRNNAYRCNGRGLWWDAGRRGQPRRPWTVTGPRDMGMEGQIRVRFGKGTEGYSCGAHGNVGRASEEERNIFIEALSRQLECRACDKRICGVHPAHDERNPSLEEVDSRAWAPAFVRVDTIRCKLIRSRTFTSFLT
jgi:hypothetical protein